MKKIIPVLIAILFLFGCAGGDQQQVEMTSPFIGGAVSVSTSFVDLRTEVFDGGKDPFDVVIKLENLGETRVAKEDIRVKLSGFNPVEFSKTEADLIKSPEDDLSEKFKDPQGNVVPGAPVFIEYKGLNHNGYVTGTRVDFPIRADVCYMYGTKAVSRICIRRNLLNPQAGGICEITGTKPIFNSAAPVQFVNFQETSRSKDKIGFSFEVKNMGAGDLFEMGSICDRSERRFQDKVYVKVGTNMNGLTCTGLESDGKTAEGVITLFDNTKLITCTQEVSTSTDFEQTVTMEGTYDYEQFIQSQITIKSSGEI